MYQDWVDTRLEWDPTEFNNITLINVPRDTVWNPDVVMYEL